MKKQREKTGGVRMLQMFDSGKLSFRGGQFIDLYNQCVLDNICITVTTRIDQCNHYWVTEVHDTT